MGLALFQTHYFSENLAAPVIEPGQSIMFSAVQMPILSCPTQM
jgi:hypothetical protein